MTFTDSSASGGTNEAYTKKEQHFFSDNPPFRLRLGLLTFGLVSGTFRLYLGSGGRRHLPSSPQDRHDLRRGEQ